MTDWINEQAIALLGADTPGVIAAGLHAAYAKGRADMRDEAEQAIVDVYAKTIIFGAAWEESDRKRATFAMRDLEP